MSEAPPTLFTMPGTCALSVHIALEWAGAHYALEILERGENRGDAYLAINPAGQVPALRLGDGRVLTEAHAILLWVADAHPHSALAPASSDPIRRYAVEEILAFMTGEVHGAFVPLFIPQRFHPDPEQAGAVKKAARERLMPMFTRLDGRIGAADHLLGGRTVADAFLYVLTRWAEQLSAGLEEFPNLSRFRDAMERDEGVATALRAQGMKRAGA